MAPAKDTTTPDPTPEVPAAPAPETAPPADPPTPPADPAPPVEEEGPALCETCFPWGLPEGYLTAGCEHVG